jgi:isopentenyl-diphosphate delta-isomerase type 1
MQEYFDVVNEDDVVVGRCPGIECVNRGLLHRAVVVFLTNSQGEVYIQKRASNLIFFPGYWSASCTGHVSSGETYLEAAKREVKEELGVSCRLKEKGKFMSPKWKVGSRTEWEFITAYEGTSASSEITLSDETEEGKFVTESEFRQLVSSRPGTFTPDTLLALRYWTKLE